MGLLEEPSAGPVTSGNDLDGMEGWCGDVWWGRGMGGSAADGCGVDDGEGRIASGTTVTVLVAVAWFRVGEGGVEPAETAVEARGHGGRGFGGLWFGVIGGDLRDWGKEATSSSILIARVGSGSEREGVRYVSIREGFPGRDGGEGRVPWELRSHGSVIKGRFVAGGSVAVMNTRGVQYLEDL